MSEAVNETDEQRRQRKFEEQRARDRAEFDRLEKAIAPLKFSEQVGRDDDPNWNYCNRQILNEAGDVLGHVRYRKQGHYSSGPMVFEITSKRIHNTRSSWRGEGTRRYKKFDSAVTAVKKFCISVSADEERAKVLRKELDYYRRKVNSSSRRHTQIEHGDSWSHRRPDADKLVELLASDIPQNYLEGQQYLKQLIRQKKVHRRYSKWVEETFIEPRQTELDSLDTSNEHIR